MERESLEGPDDSWRRQAEILRDENSSLSNLLDAIDIGVTVQDKDHVILYENRLFRTLFGGLGRKCFQVYERRDQPCDDCPVADVFRTGRPQQSERQMVDRAGDKRFLVSTAAPLQEWNGNPAVCKVVRDITIQSQPKPQWQTSEEIYRYLIENVNEGIYIAQGGKISFINRKGTEWIGFSAEEISGRPFIDFVHPEDRDLVKERHRRRLQGEKPPDIYPFRIIDREGRMRWVELRVSLITWKGKPATLNFLHDITDRKSADGELVWTTAFLKSQVEATIDGILVVDANGKKILSNQNLLDMWKVPQHVRDDKDDTSLLQYVTSIIKCPEQFLEKVTYLYDHPNETSRDEIEFKDGMVLDRYSSPVLGTDEKYYGRIWTFRDISKRKRAEEALRQSEERYRGIFEHAIEGIFQTRLDGHFVIANPSLARILGAPSPEALTGNPTLGMPQFYTDPRHREELLWILLKQGRDVHNFQIQLNRLDGSTVWVSINARLSRSEGQEPLIEGTIEDISARKNLELQLLHSQKLDAIGTMAGGIAHDFNNILGIIIGYTEIIQSRKLPVGHKASGDLEQVLQAALRARDLVKQILSFSRQEEQALRMIQIRPLVKEAARMLRATLPATIRIRSSIQADKEMILGDPTQIYQVLINLCTNAAYAMRGTIGTLSITMTTVVFAPGEILPHPDLHQGIYQHLSISDTGEGIDPAILGRIFEPFFTTKAVQMGSGLGLSVVHGIVKAHRGAVTVESEPGRGATFHVYFPVARQAADETDAPPSEASLGGQGRILLVDDEQVLAELTAERLTNAGYEVTAMTHPLEAVHWFGRHAAEVDLVITDQTMPGMTGLKMIEELRKLKPGLPVILCTGYSESATPETVQKLGVRLVMKPVLIRDMVKAIKMQLPLKESNG